MESSDDGDGDRKTVQVASIALFAIILFCACHKPTNTIPQKVKVSANSSTQTLVLNDIKKKKSKKKKLYLTFDDGPNKGTQNVLHIAADENVPISFFIVGEHVFASRGQLQTWDSLNIAEHIALCNHSYSHANNQYNRFYQSPEIVVNDFKKSNDTLQLRNRIVRTPGRNIWRIDSLHFTDIKSSTAAADSLQKAGFMVMGWDVEWTFNPKSQSVSMTADSVLKEIDHAFAKNQTRQCNHLILLAHDQVYAKPDDSIQLRRFMQGLKEKDEYELSLVTEYPGVGEMQYNDSFVVNSVR